MFEKYTANEKKVLETAMIISAMCGTPAPTTTEEIEKWCEETLKTKAEAEKAEAEKKAKAEAKEKARAEAAGMTVEEFRAEKKRLAKIKRYEKEVKELEKEIARMEALKKRKLENLRKLRGED